MSAAPAPGKAQTATINVPASIINTNGYSGYFDLTASGTFYPNGYVEENGVRALMLGDNATIHLMQYSTTPHYAITAL